MKTAIYPGSFNPWHRGHENVLNEALLIFDKVVIWQGYNSTKDNKDFTLVDIKMNSSRIEVVHSSKLLVDYVKNQQFDAVIKGLRNAQDFEYEKIQQYWNEDLGVNIPTFYVIANRELVHISSSAIRMVEKFK